MYVEISNQDPLQVAMVVFTQISLQEHTIHVFTVRPISGGQVFFHGHERSGCHKFILRPALSPTRPDSAARASPLSRTVRSTSGSRRTARHSDGSDIALPPAEPSPSATATPGAAPPCGRPFGIRATPRSSGCLPAIRTNAAKAGLRSSDPFPPL